MHMILQFFYFPEIICHYFISKLDGFFFVQGDNAATYQLQVFSFLRSGGCGLRNSVRFFPLLTGRLGLMLFLTSNFQILMNIFYSISIDIYIYISQLNYLKYKIYYSKEANLFDKSYNNAGWKNKSWIKVS